MSRYPELAGLLLAASALAGCANVSPRLGGQSALGGVQADGGASGGSADPRGVAAGLADLPPAIDY